MKVVLVPSSYAPHLGGVESVAEHVAAGLAAGGHEPLVITNRWPKSLPENEHVGGVPVRRVAFRVPHRSARGIGGFVLYARAAQRAVVDVAREHGCDLVNVHCVSSNARYALATARTLDVPLVVSVHGELSGDAAGIYQRDPSLRAAWRRLMDRADMVTAPSQYTLDEAQHFYGRAFRSARVVRNGVDLDLFFGTPQPARPRFVLAAGRLVPNKGFDLLVDAWERLPDDLADVRLVIAGEGWAHDALRRRIDASPAAGRIELVGPLPHAELAQRMRASTAFVLPSRAEALGLVVLEAMAAGTPVVAAAVGGVPEIVQDGVTGMLFRPDDAGDLATALTRLFADEPAARQRADVAREQVAGLGWDACVAGYLDAYASATGSRS
ncbi:glycosyltransferase family 4 protein [uncultured Jatrophihabitans sp.]|uniref:glycosyltransferase family 4 protein n=1 Tax=uncultured Jatrophihabitans sp. TaxID=1610747 RepID=UPI0035C9C99F